MINYHYDLIDEREFTRRVAGIGYLQLLGAYAKAGATQSQNTNVPLIQSRCVIGKMEHISPLKLSHNEHSLIKHMPNRGSYKLNWQQNSSVLRMEMNKQQPIRDASVNSQGTLIRKTGFLRAERALLENHGWTYDPNTCL